MGRLPYSSVMAPPMVVDDTTALDIAAIDWLLASDEPGIRMQARLDLLGEAADDDAAAVLNGPMISALLAGQEAGGGFGVHPYKKWTGAHWRLVSLVELGIPRDQPGAVAALETVLDWLTGKQHLATVFAVDGRTRRCASQEGNALAAASRLGRAEDPRARLLAQSLIEWQWPDGGWNCDPRPEALHSSFNETVTPLWGLVEFASATGDVDAAEAAHRTCDLLLDHHVYQSHRTGKPGKVEWLRLRYPAYWHYDVMQGLTVLARAGALPDPRANAALDVVLAKRRTDGLWHYEGQPFWRSVGGRSYPEAVDWGRSGPSPMLTLNALRVLRTAAG